MRPGVECRRGRTELPPGDLRRRQVRAPGRAAPDPSPGANLSTLFAAQNGDLWVSGDRGTAWFHDQKWRTFASTDGSTPESVVAFAEFADGKIWCATPDKVWAFDGRNWSAVRAGLDRINALIAARDGSLWVGTDSGLHRFFQGAWVENGTEEGLPAGGVRELCEDARGRIWAGTAHGLSLYHPEADPDPPRTYVQILGERGEEHSRRRHHHPRFQRTGQMELHPPPAAALLLPAGRARLVPVSGGQHRFPSPTCPPASTTSRSGPWTATATLTPTRPAWSSSSSCPGTRSRGWC